MIRMPGWLAKSTGCCRELEAVDFLVAEVEERAFTILVASSKEAGEVKVMGDWVHALESEMTGETLKLDA